MIGGGAFLPPQPCVTSAVGAAPQDGAGVAMLVLFAKGCEPQAVATGAGGPKLAGGAAAPAAGGVYVVPTFAGKVIPPLLAPASFSCVRPYAARPSTAPMLM